MIVSKLRMIKVQAPIWALITSVAFVSFALGAKPTPKILFVRPAGGAFDEVFDSMKKGLSSKYEISNFIVSKASSYEEFKSKIQEQTPQLTVLMDNLAVDLSLKYNAANATKKLKGVAIMGLNLKNILKGNPDLSGIVYEAPAFSLVTQFRSIVESPVKTVVTFYRESRFKDEIELTRKQLATVDVKLVAFNVEKNGKDQSSIEAFLRSETKNILLQEQYDAVWIMLDSHIFSQSLFQSLWLPLARDSKIPFLTGLENLVSTDMNFATFAVTPNLTELANQTDQMIESILTDGMTPKDVGIELLVSVNKILNLQKAKDLGLKVKAERLLEVKVMD